MSGYDPTGLREHFRDWRGGHVAAVCPPCRTPPVGVPIIAVNRAIMLCPDAALWAAGDWLTILEVLPKLSATPPILSMRGSIVQAKRAGVISPSLISRDAIKLGEPLAKKRWRAYSATMAVGLAAFCGARYITMHGAPMKAGATDFDGVEPARANRSAIRFARERRALAELLVELRRRGVRFKRLFH